MSRIVREHTINATMSRIVRIQSCYSCSNVMNRIMYAVRLILYVFLMKSQN